MGFPVSRDTLRRFSMIRTKVLWGLYFGSLALGQLPNMLRRRVQEPMENLHQTIATQGLF